MTENMIEIKHKYGEFKASEFIPTESVKKMAQWLDEAFLEIQNTVGIQRYERYTK